MSSSLLITNADCINEDRRFEADLLIRDGRIDAIGGELEQPRCGAGWMRRVSLIPAMIDDQVQCREPGLTHKADLASASRAAVAGGKVNHQIRGPRLRFGPVP